MSNLASPSASLSAAPLLDRLVSYFVAAKKSLSATSHVYKANEIVEDARSLVEDSGVLKAKNAYVRAGIEDQIHVLQNIHGGLESVGFEAQVDFEIVIKSLDVANDRLQSTLDSLRKTLVSASLGNSPDVDDQAAGDLTNPHTGKEPQEPEKTLYDFIDEGTHTELLDALRGTIDSYNDAQATLHRVRMSLGESLHDVTTSVQEIDGLRPEVQGEEDIENIPSLFTSLSHNASEMASLLQSLISHYDLCITALKHTEGGGEAARAAAVSDALPNTLTAGSESPTEASLYAGADAEAARAPISDRERDEMLSVVTHDASQVDDVVLEIRERADEMASTLTKLQSHASVCRRRFDLLRALLDRLADLSTTLLPKCLSAPLAFRETWTELRTDLVSRTASLAELSQFHDSFLASYAALLREVERRRMVESKQRKIAERAMRDIEALQAEDLDMRDQFVKEAGEWLPRDIWPGLMDGPRRWVVRRVGVERVGLGIVNADEEDADAVQGKG